MALLVLNAPRLRLKGYALNVMDTHTMVLSAINVHRLFNHHNAHFAQASLSLTLFVSPAQFRQPNSYAQPARTTVMYGSVTPALLAYLHSTPLFALLAQAMEWSINSAFLAKQPNQHSNVTTVWAISSLKVFVNNVQHLLIKYLVSRAQAMCSIKANVSTVTPSWINKPVISAPTLCSPKILVLIVLLPIVPPARPAQDIIIIPKLKSASNANQ